MKISFSIKGTILGLLLGLTCGSVSFAEDTTSTSSESNRAGAKSELGMIEPACQGQYSGAKDPSDSTRGSGPNKHKESTAGTAREK